MLPTGTTGDRLVLGMAGGGDFRVIAAQTADSIELARLRCDLSPVAAAALGRALTSAVLLARLLDKQVPEQHVSLRLEGGGPLGPVIAEATIDGRVRGCVGNPQYEDTDCDVGLAIGTDGNLTVVRKSPPLMKPYTSQVRLVSGEVAKDVAHYLATSEQIPTALLLGVLNRPTGVAACGGIVIQSFPHTTTKTIEAVEKAILDAPPLSSLLAELPIHHAVARVLGSVGYKQLDPSFDIPIEYHCRCSREKALQMYRYFPPQELGEMIGGGTDTEAVCHFCGMRYIFTPDDLLGLELGTEN
ncbi:MAG: Hsp33 family molecular chaperone HslO [Acidobacteria bacterium]|nr:Hsp33 family molecular chaperone HslO [Acidobacteriota bacterium]